MRRVVAVALLVSLAAPWASSAPRAVAGEEMDPLVSDGLAALESLVSDENCDVNDASDGEVTEDNELPFRFCDDGLPPQGGGANGIPVPVAYHSRPTGRDFRALPAPASEREAARKDVRYDLRPEEDGRRITLDVDITLPPEDSVAPPGGRPVLVFMHGCCSGNKRSWEAATVDASNELYHHSNAWFATRGYVVVTYTARGFRNRENRGSTGSTQLDSRRFEINDYQYLVGLLADHDAQQAAAAEAPIFDVDPQAVAAVGGSYGGGFAWLALTDPTWKSPATRTPIRLAAAVPRYGWTDLVEALIPSGHYHDRKASVRRIRSDVAPTTVKKALSRRPIGVEKQSIVAGLFVTGNLVTHDHTTFPAWLYDVYARLQAGEPYDGDPLAEKTAREFLRDRSAYFQRHFWRRVANGLRVPTYAAATWTDPLFSTIEGVRFYTKLKALNPRYPIDMYLGDYNHFAQNKPKEWGDLCGEDHHVCTVEAFRTPGGEIDFSRAPTRVRKGVQTRTNRFLNFFVRDLGNRPPLRVTATTTICADNATKKLPVDEPGIEYRAPTWRKLAPRLRLFDFERDGVTTSPGSDDHATQSDPVYRDRVASDICYTTGDEDPGPDVVQYRTKPLERRLTLMGIPTVRLDYKTSAQTYWVAARLFDAKPSGSMTMVARGVCRVDKAAHPKVDCSRFDLFGQGWRFRPKHEIVLEITQADTPFLREDNEPSELEIKGARLELPVTPRKLRHDFRD